MHSLKQRQRSPIRLEQLMSDFMAATTSVEKYLKQGRPLTSLQFESISLAASMLQTFLNIWKIRYGDKIRLTKGKAPDPWFMNAQSHPALPANVNREKRHSAAVVLGRQGGLKGGTARAMKLSPQRRAAIARAAATARWAKSLHVNS
jgi:hypothetical protein